MNPCCPHGTPVFTWCDDCWTRHPRLPENIVIRPLNWHSDSEVDTVASLHTTYPCKGRDFYRATVLSYANNRKCLLDKRHSSLVLVALVDETVVGFHWVRLAEVTIQHPAKDGCCNS